MDYPPSDSDSSGSDSHSIMDALSAVQCDATPTKTRAGGITPIQELKPRVSEAPVSTSTASTEAHTATIDQLMRSKEDSRVHREGGLLRFRVGENGSTPFVVHFGSNVLSWRSLVHLFRGNGLGAIDTGDKPSLEQTAKENKGAGVTVKSGRLRILGDGSRQMPFVFEVVAKVALDYEGAPTVSVSERYGVQAVAEAIRSPNTFAAHYTAMLCCRECGQRYGAEWPADVRPDESSFPLCCGRAGDELAEGRNQLPVAAISYGKYNRLPAAELPFTILGAQRVLSDGEESVVVAAAGEPYDRAESLMSPVFRSARDPRIGHHAPKCFMPALGKN